MIRWFAGLLFALVFYSGSVPVAVFIALSGLISDARLRRGAALWARWFVWCTRFFLGIRLSVRGDIPQTGAIVAFKHQSAYETILTLALFDCPAVMMKAELRRIPLWGWLAERHGSIFIDRKGGGKTLRAMLRQAQVHAAAGRPILIFPEGTRVPYGQTHPVRAGLYAVAAGTRLPVVPVAIDSGRLWARGLAKRSGVITFAFQPEIPAGLPRDELESRVFAAINADPLSVDVRQGAMP